MRRRKRWHPEKKRAFRTAIAVVLTLMIIIAVRRTDRALRPVAAMQAEHFAKLSTSRIIGETVAEYLREGNIGYDDLAVIIRDENGHPSAVETLPSVINRVQSELTVLINERLEAGKNTASEIPLGSLADSAFLAGKGPRLKIRVCPLREAEVMLRSSFDSAGMNQTRHRITAVINVELTSSLPIYSFRTEAQFEFLLAESVIVGNVPFG